MCPLKIKEKLRAVGGYNDCQIKQICGEIEMVQTSTLDLENENHVGPFTDYMKLKGCTDVVLMENGSISGGSTDRPSSLGYTMASKNCRLISYDKDSECNGKNEKLELIEKQPAFENSNLLLHGSKVCVNRINRKKTEKIVPTMFPGK